MTFLSLSPSHFFFSLFTSSVSTPSLCLCHTLCLLLLFSSHPPPPLSVMVCDEVLMSVWGGWDCPLVAVLQHTASWSKLAQPTQSCVAKRMKHITSRMCMQGTVLDCDWVRVSVRNTCFSIYNFPNHNYLYWETLQQFYSFQWKESTCRWGPAGFLSPLPSPNPAAAFLFSLLCSLDMPKIHVHTHISVQIIPSDTRFPSTTWSLCFSPCINSLGLW